MPFRSEKQRRYLWMHHPEIAKKWTKEHGSKIVPSKKKKKSKKATDYRSMIKTAAINKLAGSDYQHCPVCSHSSKVIGVHGPSKQYECETCGYHFSNK